MYLKKTIAGVLAVSLPLPAFAWAHHTVYAYALAKGWKDNPTYAPVFQKQVIVEDIQSFIKDPKVQPLLEQFFIDINTWGKATQPSFHPIPDAILFNNANCTKWGWDKCLWYSLRVNPYVADVPEIYDPENVLTKNTVYMPQAYILKDRDKFIPNLPTDVLHGLFVSSGVLPSVKFLHIGDKVPYWMVFSSDSAFPDYALNLSGYDNSPSDFGRLYGFGKNPLDIPTNPMTSQILSHVSTYHENKIAFIVNPGIKATYPEYYANMFYKLSAIAYKTGHYYWSAKFLGWGSHYIQDATQPYHTGLTIGFSTPYVMFAYVMNMLGFHKWYDRFTNEESFNHLFMENIMQALLSNPNVTDLKPIQDKLWKSVLDDSGYDTVPVCDLGNQYLQREITAKVHSVSNDFNAAIENSLTDNIKDNYAAAEDNVWYFNYLTATHSRLDLSHSVILGQEDNLFNAIGDRMHVHSMYLRACIDFFIKHLTIQ
jgi:hypothetical protein